MKQGQTESEYLQDQRTKINMAIDTLCNVLNSFSAERTDDMLVDALLHNHRTLQQSFWRTINGAMHKYAKVEYDLRNEGSVRMCERLAEVIDKEYLYQPHV
jgi:hypothetical protein